MISDKVRLITRSARRFSTCGSHRPIRFCKTVRAAGWLAAEAREIEAIQPLPDAPWIFSRTILESPPARAITERARQNTRHPAKSHPDQESLFPSTT
jgi:hypothetical protein